MKKIFSAMTILGVVLAMATAGGADAGNLPMTQIVVQALISTLMVLCGTHFVKEGDAA
ncbi:MAG: hypothetical protein IJ316_05670 [Clostridia bacterium]|nr:hypothetical protein [Clostridia bacterium]